MASWPAKLVTVVISSGLALGVLELGVRRLAPQPLGAGQAPALLRGKLTKPGDHPLKTSDYTVEVHVNAQGFVDAEWPTQRRPDVPRVVVIGDSFVQAAQVELSDGFGRVLARRLSERMGREVEVLSLGVPGAGTATALGLLEKYALELKPDAVVLGFLVANDVMNNHPLLEGKTDKPFYRLEGGELVPSDRVDYRAQPWKMGPLWENSHTWRWAVRANLTRRETKRQITAGDGLPLALRVHDPSPDPIWEDAWALTDALLQATAARCDAAEVPFGILLFPDAIQATRTGVMQMKARWQPTSTWDVLAATERAHRMAARHGVVQDLRPTLAEADEMGLGSLYYREDSHWTPRGHAVAAQGAVELVVELLGSP
jgi:hypothetical protein